MPAGTKLHATASEQDCAQDQVTSASKAPRGGLLSCFGCGITRTNSDKLKPNHTARAAPPKGPDSSSQAFLVVANSSGCGSKNLKAGSPPSSLKTRQSEGPQGTAPRKSTTETQVLPQEPLPSPFNTFVPPITTTTPSLCPPPSTSATEATRSPLPLATGPSDNAFAKVFQPWRPKPRKPESSNLRPASAGAVLDNDDTRPGSSRAAFTSSRAAPSRTLSHSLPRSVGPLGSGAAAIPAPLAAPPPAESRRLPDEESEVITLGAAGLEADEDKEKEYGDEAGPRDERARDSGGVPDRCDGGGENGVEREVELEQPPGLVASDSLRRPGSAVSASSRVASASAVVQAAPALVSGRPRSALDTIPEPCAVNVRRGASCNGAGVTTLSGTGGSRLPDRRCSEGDSNSTSLIGPGTTGPLGVGLTHPLTPPLRPCTSLRPTPLSSQPPLPAEPLLIHTESSEVSQPLLPSGSQRLAPLTSPVSALIASSSLTSTPLPQLLKTCESTSPSQETTAPQPSKELRTDSSVGRQQVMLPPESEPQPISPSDEASEDGHVIIWLPPTQPPCFPKCSVTSNPTSSSSAKLPRAGMLAPLQPSPHSGCHSLPSSEVVEAGDLLLPAGPSSGDPVAVNADASQLKLPEEVSNSVPEAAPLETPDQELNTPRSQLTPTPQRKETVKEEQLRLDPDPETQAVAVVPASTMSPKQEAEKEEQLRLDSDPEAQEAPVAPTSMISPKQWAEKAEQLRLDPDPDSQEAAVALRPVISPRNSQGGDDLHLEDRSDLDPIPQPVAGSADEGQISAGMVTAPSPEAAAPATDAAVEANTIDDVDSVVGALPPPPSLRPTPSSVLRGVSMAPMHRSSSSVATAAAVVAATGPAARDSLKDLLQEIEAEGKVKKGE